MPRRNDCRRTGGGVRGHFVCFAEVLIVAGSAVLSWPGVRSSRHDESDLPGGLQGEVAAVDDGDLDVDLP